MALLGDKAWYLAKWLDRIVPDVDVEGVKLERAHSFTPSTDRAEEAPDGDTGQVPQPVS